MYNSKTALFTHVRKPRQGTGNTKARRKKKKSPGEGEVEGVTTFYSRDMRDLFSVLEKCALR